MAGLRLVEDADVPLHVLADRLREVGHWVPPDALEQAVDLAIQASPPALLMAVRARLRRLGAEDGADESGMFARLLELFAARGPEALARIEAAVDGGDPVGAAAAAGRLARQADALGAAPLALLCARLRDRATAGDLALAAGDRAALRREVSLTCRVLARLAADLSGRTGVPVPA